MSDDVNYQMMLDALASDFLDETSDKLEDIEICLQNLEQRSGKTSENITLIKRDIHSIKGAGAPFGFPTISKLCHGLENYIETTSNQENLNVTDVRVFVDGVASIVDERKEPDEHEQEMLLKSLPSGRQQSGVMALTKGIGLLIMPLGLQRKIVGQELAQLGFKLTLEDNPLSAFDTAFVLKPDFIIVSMINDRLTGIEIANMFHAANALREIPFAVLSASDVEDLQECPETTTFIHKGRTFTADMLAFVTASSS